MHQVLDSQQRLGGNSNTTPFAVREEGIFRNLYLVTEFSELQFMLRSPKNRKSPNFCHRGLEKPGDINTIQKPWPNNCGLPYPLSHRVSLLTLFISSAVPLLPISALQWGRGKENKRRSLPKLQF